MVQIEIQDRERLRALAAQVREISERPEQARKARLWQRHNDLETHEPLVFIDPENGWNEILTPQSLCCQGELARQWEYALRREIFWGNCLKDDKVIDGRFSVPYAYHDTGWGLKLTRIGGENGGAYHIKQAIEDYERDFEKVHYPQIVLERERSEEILALAQEVLGDILRVERRTQWWWSLGLTWKYIDLRGLEDFMCDFLLEPEWVHRMMELLCSGALSTVDFLEREGLLCLNSGNQYVGSGGFGFTSQLPQEGALDHSPKAGDLWGFVESQETVSVSPEMYGEFIFPYHRRIAERFGLNCYGCCEPFEGRWQYVRQLPRLRRVSCSPWSDRRRMEELLGADYVASIKLLPTPLSLPHMNEDEVRAQLREALEYSRNCVPELIMKDTNTLGNNPQNAVRWVEIAREEIARL